MTEHQLIPNRLNTLVDMWLEKLICDVSFTQIVLTYNMS